MTSFYPNKKPLFVIAMIVSILFWIGLLGLIRAIAHSALALLGISDFETNRLLLLLIVAFVSGVFVVDYLRRMRQVVTLRSSAVEISAKQFPDLFGRIQSVCRRLKIADLPIVYLYYLPKLGGTTSVRFHGKDYLALEAETVGALTDRQSAIDFLMGYELARLHDASARWKYFLWPAMVIPLLGPAYTRSLIYSFDRAGILACKTKVDAALGLAIRAAGTRRWKSLNIPQFASQSADNRSLWMSVNELISARPWLSKRMAHLRAIATNSDTFIPRRNPISYFVAAVFPYIQINTFKGWFHLALILLWITLGSFWGDRGYQKLQNLGLLDWLGDKQEAPKSAFFTRNWLPQKDEAEEYSGTSRYIRLHADLRQLGKLAKTRSKKYGDIPCEVGNIRGIKLNYRSSRYAYSCEQPLVYTRVAHGEFEPGRAAHVQSYNWEKNVILETVLSNKSDK